MERDSNIDRKFTEYLDKLLAGEDIKGDRFSCILQSIAQAIDKGVYQPVDVRAYKQQLESSFPKGVCDYSQPDPARPMDLLSNEKSAHGYN